MTGNPPAIHYRTSLGRILCGRRPAGGLAGPAGSNHVRDAATCRDCRRRLDGKR
jgi:hypothetical protein